jgi:hypothetical protein
VEGGPEGGLIGRARPQTTGMTARSQSIRQPEHDEGGIGDDGHDEPAHRIQAQRPGSCHFGHLCVAGLPNELSDDVTSPLLGGGEGAMDGG